MIWTKLIASLLIIFDRTHRRENGAFLVYNAGMQQNSNAMFYFPRRINPEDQTEACVVNTFTADSMQMGISYFGIYLYMMETFSAIVAQISCDQSYVFSVNGLYETFRRISSLRYINITQICILRCLHFFSNASEWWTRREKRQKTEICKKCQLASILFLNTRR